MARTRGGTVKETGAYAGDVLIGMEEMNRNLLIQVHEDQRAGDGKRITGRFDLLRAGDGSYHEYIAEHFRDDPYTADELIRRIRFRDEDCTHILNKNSLLRVRLPLPRTAGDWCFSN
jgi:hypothetical protein